MSIDIFPTPDEIVPNFRDAGAFVNLIAGREILHERRLLRGGSIRSCFCPEEIDTPDVILCLKGGIERGSWARTLHFPRPDTQECYDLAAHAVRDWLGRIAEALVATGPARRLFVHCHAGRDRTGVVVAMLLKSAGIPDEVIAEEYSLSADAPAERMEQALNALGDIDRLIGAGTRDALQGWLRV